MLVAGAALVVLAMSTRLPAVRHFVSDLLSAGQGAALGALGDLLGRLWFVPLTLGIVFLSLGIGLRKSDGILWVKEENAKYLLTAIVAVALLLRLRFFVGLAAADDFAYCQHACNVIHGKYDISLIDFVYGLRWGILLPTGLAFVLFGISDFSAVLFPLLCSVGNLLLAYFLAKLVFESKTVALLSALLLSFFPLEILNSTMLLPEVMFTFFIGASILSFLKAETRNAGWGLYFLSGALAAAAYLVRANSLVILGLFFICYVLMTRKLIWSYALGVAGLLLIFVLEALFYHIQTGDAFFRYHVIQSTYANLGDLRTDLSAYIWDLFPAVEGNFLTPFGFYPYFLVFSAILWIAKAPRRTFVPILLLGVSFAYLEFGIMSLNPAVLIHKHPRFLSVLFLPASMLIAYALKESIFDPQGKGNPMVDAKKRWLRPLVAFLAVCVLLTTSVSFTDFYAREYRSGMAKYREAADYLKDFPQRDVYYVHWRWPLRLNFYLGYQTGYNHFGTQEERSTYFKDIRKVKDVGLIEDAFVIIDMSFFEPGGELTPLSYDDFPSFVRYPPADWQLAAEFDRTLLYLAPDRSTAHVDLPVGD
jgi:hypothetical protein